MTTATAPTSPMPETDIDGHDDTHSHPSDGRYWVIALILAVVTALEVAVSYIEVGNAEAPLLLLGMVIKFWIVAAFFMHLKFDSRVLRRLLISGLVLAVSCYMAMLFMFRHMDKDSRSEINFVESDVTGTNFGVPPQQGNP